MVFPKQNKEASEDGFDSSSDHVSESLSDIDDAEISCYLNTKKEVIYKTILWEAMHKDYVVKRSTTRKRSRNAKEAGPVKKAAKASTVSKDSTEKLDEKDGNGVPDVKRGRSSKINYSVLGEEGYRFEEGLEGNAKINSENHSEEVGEEQGGCEDDHEYNEVDRYEQGYNDDDDNYNAYNDYNEYNDDGGFDDF